MMSELIPNYERVETFRSILNTVLQPFASRAHFEAAPIPPRVIEVRVIEAETTYRLRRDPAGDWVDGSGALWVATPEASLAEMVSVRDQVLDLAPSLGLRRLGLRPVNTLFTGFDDGAGTDTRLFAGASSTPQGVAYAEIAGEEHVWMLQKVSGGSWTADERQRICHYVLDRTAGALMPIDTTEPMSIGHQMLSATVDADGQVWLYASIPVGGHFVDANMGKGFARLPWRGPATTAADMEIFQVFGDAGTTHFAAAIRRAYVSVSASGRHLVLAASDVVDDPTLPDDAETPDTRILVYDLPAVLAAPDPKLIAPIASWLRPKPSVERAQYVQGIACDDRHISVQSGFVTPLLPHVTQIMDMMTGAPVQTLVHEGPRNGLSYDALMGTGPDGILISAEPEGNFYDRNGHLVELSTLFFRVPGDVVQFRGRAYACYRETAPGVSPHHELHWMPTHLPVTAGEWSPTATYAPGVRHTRRDKVLTALVPVEDGVQPLDRGYMLAASAASLPLGSSPIDISYRLGDELWIHAWAASTQSYFRQIGIAGGHKLRLHDTRPGSASERFLELRARFDALRRFAELRFGGPAGATAADGLAINFYAADDELWPNRMAIFLGLGSIILDPDKATFSMPVHSPGGPVCVHSAPGGSTSAATEELLADGIIPGGLMGPNGVLRFDLLTEQTNIAGSGNKSLRLVLGGQSVLATVDGVTGSTGTERVVTVRNVGAVNQQVFAAANAAMSPSETAATGQRTAAINTDADMVWQVYGSCTVPTDMIALRHLSITAVQMP